MTTVVKTESARPVTPLGILVEQLEKIVKMAETTEIPSELSDAIKQAYQLGSGIDRSLFRRKYYSRVKRFGRISRKDSPRTMGFKIFQ